MAFIGKGKIRRIPENINSVCGQPFGAISIKIAKNKQKLIMKGNDII